MYVRAMYHSKVLVYIAILLSILMLHWMTVVAVGIGVNWHVTNIGWQQQPSVYLRRVCVCVCVPCHLSQRCTVWPHYRFSGEVVKCVAAGLWCFFAYSSPTITVGVRPRPAHTCINLMYEFLPNLYRSCDLKSLTAWMKVRIFIPIVTKMLWYAYFWCYVLRM